VFGLILIFLGAMDSMLAWRGGFSASEFYSILIFCGVLLFAFGSIRQSQTSEATGQATGEEPCSTP
jgi:hypothetical protein